MLIKIVEDVGCSKKLALAWSLSAKNALNNVYGFSPNQLAFGHNPNLPVLCESTVATAEEKTSSQLIGNHLNAMHAARRAFVECESSDKMRRALKSQTRTATVMSFEAGDKVFYKRNNSARWKGPGKVIGVDHKQIFVKHGGEYFRVSPIDIQLVEPKKESTAQIEENGSNGDNRFLVKGAVDSKVAADEGDVPDEPDERETDSVADFSDSEERNTNDGEDDAAMQAPVDCDDDENVNPEPKDPNPTIADGIMPEKGSKLRFKGPGSDVWETVTVVSRAGKSNGKHKWWTNVCSEDGALKSVNMEELDVWEYVDDEVLCATLVDSQAVLEAKLAELQNLKHHEVYTEVDQPQGKVIHSTWVISEKWIKGQKKTKARLVAKGFQEGKCAGIRSDSPTCLKTSLRLILCIASSSQWMVRVLDITSAFLQGRQIQREVYLKPPKEAGSKGFWKLKKTIYGLSDASRQWYLKVKESLIAYGMTMSIYDEAFFFNIHKGQLQGMIALHVDDFFYCGTKLFQKHVMERVKKQFSISKEAAKQFSYVGLEIEQKETELNLHQGAYINKLEMMQKDNSSKKGDALTGEQSSELRAIIGQLAWVAGQTRPDISFDVCQLNVGFNKATISDVMRANKCIKRLKMDQFKICFPDLGDLSQTKLVVFTDASFNNLGNGGSQGGHVVFLVGTNGKHAVLAWKSKKLKRVVKSTLAAETLAFSTGVERCMLFGAMLKELSGGIWKIPIIGITDCHSLYDALHSSHTIEDDRLMIDIAVLRDYLRQNELQEVSWVESPDQLADVLTKSGASSIKLVNALKGDVQLHH